MTICQPRQVLRQTLYGTLLIDARPLSRLSGSGFMTSSGLVAKNSTMSFQKLPAYLKPTCSYKKMRTTHNSDEAGRGMGFPTTFGETGAIMRQRINKQLCIITDFSLLQMIVLKNGIEVDWRDCSGMSLTAYNRLFRTLALLHTQGKTEVCNG